MIVSAAWNPLQGGHGHWLTSKPRSSPYASALHAAPCRRVALTALSVIDVADGCDYIGDTASVSLQAALVASSSDRNDIGLYVATDTGNALTGTCYHDFLPPPLDAKCEPTATGTGPFCSNESDACGDIQPEQGTVLYNLGYRSIPATDPVFIGLPCVDADNDGMVDLGTVVVWDTVTSSNCSLVSQAVATSPSRCRQALTNISGLPVPLQTIEVIKALVPSSNDGTFSLQVDGVTEADGGGGTTTSPVPVTVGSHTVGELASNVRFPLSESSSQPAAPATL